MPVLTSVAADSFPGVKLWVDRPFCNLHAVGLAKRGGSCSDWRTQACPICSDASSVIDPLWAKNVKRLPDGVLEWLLVPSRPLQVRLEAGSDGCCLVVVLLDECNGQYGSVELYLQLPGAKLGAWPSWQRSNPFLPSLQA